MVISYFFCTYIIMKEKQGITDLQELINSMEPILNEGQYVFCTTTDVTPIPRELPICEIKEKEGTTLVIRKQDADRLGLAYTYIASWITLSVHSSLSAVGLTAAFAAALGHHNISCNVIAGYYHDHIFVDIQDAPQAIKVLSQMSQPDK